MQHDHSAAQHLMPWRRLLPSGFPCAKILAGTCVLVHHPEARPSMRFALASISAARE